MLAEEMILCKCKFCQAHVVKPVVQSDAIRERFQRAYGGRELPGLRRIRKERGLTQFDLSLASGVSQPMISDFELGVQFARRYTARALAEALNCSVNELEES